MKFKITEEELKEAIDNAIARIDLKDMVKRILKEIEQEKFDQEIEAYKKYVEENGSPIEKMIERWNQEPEQYLVNLEDLSLGLKKTRGQRREVIKDTEN